MNGYGVYVHLPFCVSRCRYCDFTVNVRSDAEGQDAYYRALHGEWAREALPSGPVVSVYFGGGTPSLAPPAVIGRLLEAVGRRAPLAADAEITLEANPGTVTPETLAGLRAAGVNRLSLGLQAAQDAHLAAMNRRHTFADAVAAMKWARAAGFDNVSLDALYGLPAQTAAEWRDTLDALIALEPEHVSLYQLQVEPRTWLGRRVNAGRVRLPDPDAVADMGDVAEACLAAAGYGRYEVSNFARPGRASRHNRGYWRQRPYIGLGVGAHSFDAGRRWWNLGSVPEYIRRVRAAVDPEAGGERLTVADLRAEFLWLGLRETAGVRRQDFVDRYGLTIEEAFAGVVQDLASHGLLEVDPVRIRLSRRGMDMANRVLAEFLPDLPEKRPALP